MLLYAILKWCSLHTLRLGGRSHIKSRASQTGLHVVRTGFSSYWRGQTLHLSRAETTVSINTKFWTNDNVGQIRRIAKFHGSRFYGSGSPFWWNIQFQIFGSFFEFFLLLLIILLVSSTRLQTTIRKGLRRMMAQKTWFGVRMCLLGIRSVEITFRGSTSSKTAAVWKSQPKRKRPKMLINFAITRNAPIAVMNHW